MTRDARRRDRAVRRGDHERRSVGRRLRLRERRARAHRGRRPDRARRASTGTRWRSSRRSRCASAMRAGHTGVRAPRQPGVVVRELRAVRPARAAADDGPRPSRSGPRSPPPRPSTAAGAASTASCTSTASSSTWSTVRYVATSVRSQESNALAGQRGRQRARAPPRRRRRRRRRPRHGHAARLTGSSRRASARKVDALRALVSQPAPDEPRRPHVRAARRTGRFSPSPRCSPRGRRAAHPRGPSPRPVPTSGRRPG